MRATYLLLPSPALQIFKETRDTYPDTSPITMMTHRVRLLSWNIDMDTTPILSRTRALVRHIRHLNPDIVCLQEVTPESLAILSVALRPQESRTASSEKQLKTGEADSKNTDTSKPSYLFHLGNKWAEELPYFPIMLTRLDFLTNLETRCERFPASRMYRGYILAKGQLAKEGPRLAFLTSHLESLKESASERKDQLQQVFTLMRELVLDGHAAIFAGDTNLREPEVSAKDVYKTLAAEKQRVERNPEDQPKKRRRLVESGKFVDAWLAGGALDSEKFTWDMSLNDNLQFNASFRPKARYDRSFLLWPEDIKVNVDRFRLVGKERLAVGKYVSDHWGMCIDLAFTRKGPLGKE
eukprot:GFKZ01004550.1.p1 GENE.GFKZ01004550.1~~GFKZ01004550.1.p1  ORF type:complete len:353 (+),score=43.70 GFKZ01004550.1:129-1187(+)